MSVLKYSATRFSTAHTSVNARTSWDNIKIKQNFYIASIEPSLTFKNAKKH